MQRWRLSQGFNLLELMLALFIVAAILFASIRYFSNTAQQSRITQAVRLIDAVVMASYQWNEGASNFANITMAKLKEGGYLPAVLSNSAANPWQGNIEIGPAENPHHLFVRLTRVPHQACLSLKQQLQRHTVTTVGKTPTVTNCPQKSSDFWAVF